MKYSYCDDGDSSGVAVGFGAGVEMFFNLASHRQLMFILTQSLVLRKNRNAFYCLIPRVTNIFSGPLEDLVKEYCRSSILVKYNINVFIVGFKR